MQFSNILTETLTELLLLETPIAIYQLRKGIDPEVLKKAREIGTSGKVTYDGERRGKDSQKNDYREFKFTVGEHDRKVRVRVFGKPTSSRNPTWVHCDCGDFRYRWDWVLTKKESSSLYQTKNRPPVIRNPEKKRSVCKHVAAAFDWLRKEKGI